MSPDKKWFWDGTAWRPIPVHEAAFPSWKGLGAGFTPDSAQPVPAYRMAAPAPGVAAPRWVQASRRLPIPKAGLFAGGIVGLVLVVALVSVMGTLAISQRSAAPAVQPAASPTAGPATRSDEARAAYLVKALTAPMSDLKDTTSQTRTACVVGMTSSCADTFIAIDNQTAAMLPVLQKANVPLCVAPQEAKLQADMGTMSAGAQLAFKGFRDNKKSEFASGVAQVNSVSGAVQTDFAAMSTAAGHCESQLTGP